MNDFCICLGPSDEHSHHCHVYLQGRIKDLEDPWISVSDRLPVDVSDEDRPLFAVTYRGHKRFAYFNESTGIFFDCGDYLSIGGVTHWMKIPEPKE